MVSIFLFIVLAVTLSSGVRSPRQRALILAGVIAGFGIGAAWGALVLIALGRRARARV